MLAFIGIPCFFLEITIGQYAAMGPVTIYSNLSPVFKGNVMRHSVWIFKHCENHWLTFFSTVVLCYWHLMKICILTIIFLQVWDLPTLWPPVLWAYTTTWLLHGPSTTFLLLSLPSYHGIHAKTISTHHVRVNFKDIKYQKTSKKKVISNLTPLLIQFPWMVLHFGRNCFISILPENEPWRWFFILTLIMCFCLYKKSPSGMFSSQKSL